MNVVWTPEARQDRAAIWNYLKSRNPDAAVRIDQLFSDAAARLVDFPMLGHPGEIAGTRELTPHRSYRLVYEVVENEVWILVLIHTAREWPSLDEQR
ncbi:type II toxin-antitoxin system RelE/ParE family toxin [Sphingomonas sp.]|uniref:type II toxin-antitoxin system RelE/ParE family toxin n=1 Tax=Sphingomonas sp. TaxID=28214 RepID=UPI0035BC7617